MISGDEFDLSMAFPLFGECTKTRSLGALYTGEKMCCLNAGGDVSKRVNSVSDFSAVILLPITSLHGEVAGFCRMVSSATSAPTRGS